MKKIWIILFISLEVNILAGVEKADGFSTTTLKSINCSVQVPDSWTVFDKSNNASSSWIITPQNLDIGPYQTGVRIDSLSQVKDKTGVIASKWVADRVKNKSNSVEELSSGVGSLNDYFKFKRLVYKEVYSVGRVDYTTYRVVHSWYWNDTHDVVICVEARTPDKSWKLMSIILEKVGDLKFDELEWKKQLEETKE